MTVELAQPVSSMQDPFSSDRPKEAIVVLSDGEDDERASHPSIPAPKRRGRPPKRPAEVSLPQLASSIAPPHPRQRSAQIIDDEDISMGGDTSDDLELLRPVDEVLSSVTASRASEPAVDATKTGSLPPQDLSLEDKAVVASTSAAAYGSSSAVKSSSPEAGDSLPENSTHGQQEVEDAEDEEEEEYEVEAILDMRKRGGKTHFLLKWKGYSDKFNSWEPEEHLACNEMIEAFKAELAAKRKKLDEPPVKASKKAVSVPPSPPAPSERATALAHVSAIAPSVMLASPTLIAPSSSKNVIKGRSEKFAHVARAAQAAQVAQTGKIIQATKPVDSVQVLKTIRALKSTQTNMTSVRDHGVAPEIAPAVRSAPSRNAELAARNVANFQRLLAKVDPGPLITVVNEHDEEGEPPQFRYINESFYGPGVPLPDPNFLAGCNCLDACSDDPDCSCFENNEGQMPYNARGLLQARDIAVHECNYKCKCGPDCPNRVIQKGRTVPMTLYRFGNGKGWGVLAGDDIPPGKFISTYVGEIITEEESELRYKVYSHHDRTYLFDLDYFDQPGSPSEFTVDARQYGNISHFFNHSCEPNLRVVAYLIDNMNQKLHKLAFFSSRAIKKGEELTFDYLGLHGKEVSAPGAPGQSLRRGRRKPEDFQLQCLCGARKCRGTVYS